MLLHPDEMQTFKLAKQVAHLRYPNHGKQFKELEKKLVGKLTSSIDRPSTVC